MKKVVFILTLLFAFNLNAANEIILPSVDYAYTSIDELPLAPPAVGLYHFLATNDQFVNLAQAGFVAKCKDILTNVPASTTNAGELRQIAFAKAILVKDIKVLRHAVLWTCNSDSFTSCEDINAALSGMRDNFDNNFINICQGQP